MRSTATALCLLFCLLSSVSIAPAEDEVERRVYETRRVNPHPPLIDGRLSEACWDAADWAGDFIQRTPAEGEAPSQRTAFKLLYNDEALYFAFRAFDEEPTLIEKRLARFEV